MIGMGFWQKLFRKKGKQEIAEDWDKIVYAREDVNFSIEEERHKYISGCLEQISEASKEMDLLTGEYTLVTAYLTDMEEIEALPEEERGETDKLARKLQTLDKERAAYHDKKNRMKDSEYHRMKAQENEVEEGIGKLQEAEGYAELVKKDLQRLDRERHAYVYRRNELEAMLANFKGMAVIFLAALILCILMLLVMQFAFEMNTFIGYFLSVSAAAIAITVLCVKYLDADKEKKKVERAVNRIIQLQNKVKIRYVNNTNLLDYLYIKYDAKSAADLKRRWKLYQEEKDERKQYAEAEAKIEYYQKQLVSRLSHYQIKNPARWVNQSSALLDSREMVEIRHELILRRQALRKQMDYNHNIAETARQEIMDVVQQYPAYAPEILSMVDSYEKNSDRKA